MDNAHGHERDDDNSATRTTCGNLVLDHREGVPGNEIKHSDQISVAFTLNSVDEQISAKTLRSNSTKKVLAIMCDMASQSAKKRNVK